MSEFPMPSLGADMDAGTLVEWMKKPGDRVNRGDAIAAVETQKGAIEIEVFESGVLEKILVPVGEKVPVGTVLAIIRGDGETTDVAAATPHVMPASATTIATTPTVSTVSLPSPPEAEAIASSTTSIGVKMSPAAKRRAVELGIDLSTLVPASDGVIGLREVEAARSRVESGGLQKSGEEAVKTGIDLDEMRKAIAAAMQKSWREIPHYFVASRLDMSAMQTWLKHENERRPVPERLHYAAILIKAIALALKSSPQLNGHFGEHGFVSSREVNLGVAIAMRGGGLIAPAILAADTLELDAVMVRLNDLVSRVRGGRLRSSELSSSTATLTNLGDNTADSVQPVIYPPQVAIIGCGQMVERAWADNGIVSTRQTMLVTVGGDHRVSDGRSAAKFLRLVDAFLQHPERL